MFSKIDQFHKTKKGYATFAVIEIILFYGVASLAIDTGSMVVYALGILLIVGIIVNITNLVKLSLKK